MAEKNQNLRQKEERWRPQCRPNFIIRDVGLRSGDVALSYNSDIGSKRNNRGVGSSSSSVVIDNTGILGLE